MTCPSIPYSMITRRNMYGRQLVTSSRRRAPQVSGATYGDQLPLGVSKLAIPISNGVEDGIEQERGRFRNPFVVDANEGLVPGQRQ